MRIQRLILPMCLAFLMMTGAADAQTAALEMDGFSLELPDGWTVADHPDEGYLLLCGGEDCRMGITRSQRRQTRAPSADKLIASYEQAQGVDCVRVERVGDTDFLYATEELRVSGETVLFHIYTAVYQGCEYHFAFVGEDQQTVSQQALKVVSTFAPLEKNAPRRIDKLIKGEVCK